MSGVSPKDMEYAIRSRLGAVHCVINDSSGGCGQAYEVVIVSPMFDGKNKLARHRLVNSALKDEISKIHAFTQKSFTPAEWQAANSN